MKIKLYHGTSSHCLNEIKEKGMPDGAYLTSDDEQAQYYAEVVSEENNAVPVILVIEVDTDNLWADRPSFDEPLHFTIDEHANSEDDWHEMIENDEIPYPKQRDWQISLEYVKSVYHPQAIALEHINFNEDASLNQEDLDLIEQVIQDKSLAIKKTNQP
jgi:hypothetical protein